MNMMHNMTCTYHYHVGPCRWKLCFGCASLCVWV